MGLPDRGRRPAGSLPEDPLRIAAGGRGARHGRDPGLGLPLPHRTPSHRDRRRVRVRPAEREPRHRRSPDRHRAAGRGPRAARVPGHHDRVLRGVRPPGHPPAGRIWRGHRRRRGGCRSRRRPRSCWSATPSASASRSRSGASGFATSCSCSWPSARSARWRQPCAERCPGTPPRRGWPAHARALGGGTAQAGSSGRAARERVGGVERRVDVPQQGNGLRGGEPMAEEEQANSPSRSHSWVRAWSRVPAMIASWSKGRRSDDRRDGTGSFWGRAAAAGSSQTAR